MKKSIKSLLFKVGVLKVFKNKGVFVNRYNPLTYVSIGLVFCFYFIKQDMSGLVNFVTTK